MWLLLLGLGGFYFIFRSLYRLYLHPLHRFPGPKLAAITHGYEFYHDVLRKGMYIWEVEKMHKKYGSIVRINPYELHIKDPYYYDEIYAPSSRKRDKYKRAVPIFGAPSSMVATVGHDHHRFRRGLLNNFFSKRSVLELLPIIYENESKLMRRFEKACQEDEKNVLELGDAFAAFTADLISQYSWGVSSRFLDDENFNNDVRRAGNSLASILHSYKFFPILIPIARAMPRWLISRLNPTATALLDMQNTVSQQFDSHHQKKKKLKPEPEPEPESESESEPDKTSRKTLFDGLSDPTVPPEERTPRRLEDEGLIVLLAGTESTARALALAAFYIYHQDKPLVTKLREELRSVMPTPTTEPSLTQLEQLPYLTGVVNEAIRCSQGPVFRSPRIAPSESLTYKGHVIPPGSPVSMSSYFVLTDPEIFPDPESFKPERWIRDTEQGQNHLTRFLVSFSKGSRICLGINLAYAELYITIAIFVRRFDMEIYKTTLEEDIRSVRELAVGYPKNGDFSVRAKITNVIKE